MMSLSRNTALVDARRRARSIPPSSCRSSTRPASSSPSLSDARCCCSRSQRLSSGASAAPRRPRELAFALIEALVDLKFS